MKQERQSEKPDNLGADVYPEIPEGKNYFDRMIQGLRCKDPILNKLSAEILISTQHAMGANIVTPLANEAALPGKQPDHRIRILDVIQRIGGTLDPDAFYAVWYLMNHPVERVARKAAEVISNARHPPSCVTTKQ